MDYLHNLLSTPIGRALYAYYVALPRLALVNLLFALSLVPMVMTAFGGNTDEVGVSSLPTFLVTAMIVNLASSEVRGSAMRWKTAFAHPNTYLNAFVVWLIGVVNVALMLADPPTPIFIASAGITLCVAMIGVFAILLAPITDTSAAVVWRNAFVLAVHYPLVALGLLALVVVAAWIVLLTRGALMLLVPGGWVMVGLFTTASIMESMLAKVHTTAPLSASFERVERSLSNGSHPVVRASEK